MAEASNKTQGESDHAQENSSLVEQSAGAKSKVLPKFMGPSRLREELGSIEMRLDKVEDQLTREEARMDKIENHLIKGDDRFKELESRLSELGEGLEETRGELQAALKETRDKLVNENEALKIAHAEELSTMREDNRVLKEMVERLEEEMKEMRGRNGVAQEIGDPREWDQSSLYTLNPYGKGGETQAVHIQWRRKRKEKTFHRPGEDRRGSRHVLKCFRCKGPHKKKDCSKRQWFWPREKSRTTYSTIGASKHGVLALLFTGFHEAADLTSLFDFRHPRSTSQATQDLQAASIYKSNGICSLTVKNIDHACPRAAKTVIDLIVSKDGTGNYSKIMDAIAAAPKFSARKYNIKICKGIYYENVIVEEHKTNITFIGDGIDKTIISGNRSCDGGLNTSDTATLAGPANLQAIALRSSVQSAFYQCKFSGYQDTLCTEQDKQFYRECKIYGTIDFIFGDASVILQNCGIYPRLPLKGQSNTITAQGRSNPNETSGIVIHNCTIRAADDLKKNGSSTVKSYLGRPWFDYSRTIVMQSFIDNVIDPKGWTEWENNSTNLANIFYAEYQNRGPGASTRGRVKWTSYRRINRTQATNFTVRNFISGYEWLPSLGIPFFPDLV
ncbi:hypothetical protein GH714_010137 [Hevea brasiliensis]|uniref:Pectinesterase n=1 Tax=Hevea brasiliensis TaxID=3981 RepID=A0A6A6N009_HEVBR|nr:hypothetical protein GH714_010137 [Hevea brasiliensis]